MSDPRDTRGLPPVAPTGAAGAPASSLGSSPVSSVVVPTEAQVHATSPSALAAGVPSHVPTPGVSSSVIRSPTTPTVPDADPASLTLALSHLANTLWHGQSGAPLGDVPPLGLPTTTTTAGAPPTTGAPPFETTTVGQTFGGDRATLPPSTPPHSTPPHSTPPFTSSTAVPAVDAPAFTTGDFDVLGPVDAERAARPLPTVPEAPAAARAPAVDDGRAAHPFFVTPNFDAVLSTGDAHDGVGFDPLAHGFTLPLFDAGSTGTPHVDAPRLDGARAMPATRAPRAPLSIVEVPRFDVGHAHDPLVETSLPSSGVMGGASSFDAHAVRREFPILDERVHGKRLVWLDNAATTQKPRVVIDRLKHFYEHENSNIHRAAHALAARATDAYEGARETVRRFLNAPSVRDIVFVRGATEGINLIAKSYGARHVRAGDEILVTHLEHHANIVPWQMLCEQTGAKLVVAPVDDSGQILLDAFERRLSDKTRIVSFTQVSNALGTITPAKQMIEIAHRHGACVVLDAAQAVSHMRVDVQALDCDFLVFSGHKIFAPTGIGAVYGKSALLDETPPWQGGGNMIQDVTFERTVYQPAPMRFEAGTGNIADAVALGTALDWLTRLGLENVARHEHALLEHATALLETLPGLTIVGTAQEKAGVISFVVDGHTTHDVSTALDREGIATRGGHHCAQPILRRFGHESTVRASFAPYNTHEDVVALYEALKRIVGAR